MRNDHHLWPTSDLAGFALMGEFGGERSSLTTEMRTYTLTLVDVRIQILASVIQSGLCVF